jgi:hypothetical protein
MLSAAGSLHWLRDAVLPGAAWDELLAEAAAVPAGCESPVRPIPGRRAHAVRGPARARRLRRALAAPRPRCARTRGPGGRGVRATRFARARARAGRAAGGRPRLGRRRTECAVARDRRLGARAAAGDDHGRGGVRLRRRAPRRLPGRRLHRPREAAERCVRIAERREPNPEWTAVYREGYERYRCLYPALCAGRP